MLARLFTFYQNRAFGLANALDGIAEHAYALLIILLLFLADFVIDFEG